MSKSVFTRVGNLIVNQYEIRSVELIKPRLGVPGVVVTYKDATKKLVRSRQVPLFVQWVTGQVVTPSILGDSREDIY